MKKVIQKAMSIIIAVITLVMGVVTVNADSGITYTSRNLSAFELAADYGQTKGLTPEVIRSVLNDLMKETGFKPGKTPVISNNCWRFINEVSKRLFGFGIPGQKKNHMELNASKNWKQVGCTLSQSASNLSVDSLRELFMKSVTGDIVQMDYTQTYKNNSDSLHVMMVYSASPTGVVFYHAGSKVYFGRGNSKNPMYGTLGNGEITYEELYKYLTRSDDGLSVYRARTVTIPQNTPSSTSNEQNKWNFFKASTPEEKTPTLTETTPLNAPGSFHKYRKCFGLRGIVTTDVGAITQVVGYIDGSNGREFSYHETPNSKIWNARYTINELFLFNKLSRGSYKYTVIITATNGSKSSVLKFSRDFIVA